MIAYHPCYIYYGRFVCKRSDGRCESSNGKKVTYWQNTMRHVCVGEGGGGPGQSRITSIGLRTSGLGGEGVTCRPPETGTKNGCVFFRVVVRTKIPGTAV